MIDPYLAGLVTVGEEGGGTTLKMIAAEYATLPDYARYYEQQVKLMKRRIATSFTWGTAFSAYESAWSAENP